jgi:ubiquinol-cytochrome c reductase iron-sulfur subunit
LGEEDGWNIGKLKKTMWGTGTRLMTDGPHDMSRPIKKDDVTIGSVFHVIPEGLNDLSHEEGYADEKAKAVVLLIRLDEADLKHPENSLDGIVAFSKICTHVGCPVALYEQQTHHLLCPCHQSTFDVSDGAKVVFGPAKRPLPQLPITVDEEGYLVAEGDFPEPVGPSYWERKK